MRCHCFCLKLKLPPVRLLPWQPCGASVMLQQGHRVGKTCCVAFLDSSPLFYLLETKSLAQVHLLLVVVTERRHGNRAAPDVKSWPCVSSARFVLFGLKLNTSVQFVFGRKLPVCLTRLSCWFYGWLVTTRLTVRNVRVF